MPGTPYEHVVEALERAPDLLVPLILEMPEELRKRKKAPGKWSAHEHLCHLAAVQPMFLQRLQQMRTEDDPLLTPYDPDQEHAPGDLLAVAFDDAVARLRRERTAIVERLRELEPADWERTARHPEYERYTIYILFRHVVLHDMLHGYRIEELVLNRDWR